MAMSRLDGLYVTTNDTFEDHFLFDLPDDWESRPIPIVIMIQYIQVSGGLDDTGVILHNITQANRTFYNREAKAVDCAFKEMSDGSLVFTLILDMETTRRFQQFREEYFNITLEEGQDSNLYMIMSQGKTEEEYLELQHNIKTYLGENQSITFRLGATVDFL